MRQLSEAIPRPIWPLFATPSRDIRIRFRSQHHSQTLVFLVTSFWSFHYSSSIPRLSLFLPFRKMCPLEYFYTRMAPPYPPFGRDVNHHVMRIISSDQSAAFYPLQFRRSH